MDVVVGQLQDTLVGALQTPLALVVIGVVNAILLSGLGARVFDR